MGDNHMGSRLVDMMSLEWEFEVRAGQSLWRGRSSRSVVKKRSRIHLLPGMNDAR